MNAATAGQRATPVALVDLRLVIPAAAAWVAAWLVVAAPSLAPLAALCCWTAAGVAVAVGLLRRARGWPAQLAACLVVVAMVGTVVAVRAPARQPPEVLQLAGDGRALTVLVVAAEQIDAAQLDAEQLDAERAGAGGIGQGQTAPGFGPAARDEPVAATMVAVAARGGATRARGGSDPPVLSTSIPVLVFGLDTSEAVGIGATLRLQATIEATVPDDDVGFLVFADGDAVVVERPPPHLDWANGLRTGFAAAAGRLPGEGGDLLPGLAIGDTSAVGDELDAAMKASSLSHLTAVSGANCAIIVGLVLLLGALAGVSRRVRVAAACWCSWGSSCWSRLSRAWCAPR